MSAFRRDPPSGLGLIVFSVAALASLGGCRRSDPAQVAVVQEMATAMTRPSQKGLRAACVHLVPEQQNPMGCDNVMVPILQYAPGFPGSQVTRRGPSRGSLLGRGPVTVPLHYEGKGGRGNLDATMARVDGSWRLFSLIPSP